jgi:hypothetical protein
MSIIATSATDTYLSDTYLFANSAMYLWSRENTYLFVTLIVAAAAAAKK